MSTATYCSRCRIGRLDDEGICPLCGGIGAHVGRRKRWALAVGQLLGNLNIGLVALGLFLACTALVVWAAASWPGLAHAPEGAQVPSRRERAIGKVALRSWWPPHGADLACPGASNHCDGNHYRRWLYAMETPAAPGPEPKASAATTTKADAFAGLTGVRHTFPPRCVSTGEGEGGGQDAPLASFQTDEVVIVRLSAGCDLDLGQRQPFLQPCN